MDDPIPDWLLRVPARLSGGPRDGDLVARPDLEPGLRQHAGHLDVRWVEVRSDGFVDPAVIARHRYDLDRVARYRPAKTTLTARPGPSRTEAVWEFAGEAVRCPPRGRIGDSELLDVAQARWQAERRERELAAAERQRRIAELRAPFLAAAAGLPFRWRPARAFLGRSQAGSNDGTGDVHIVAIDPARLVRATRQPGDALCKPAAKFWGLYSDRDDDQPTCPRCLEAAWRAAHPGVALPHKAPRRERRR